MGTKSSSFNQEIPQLKTALEQQQQRHLDLTSRTSQLETSLKEETRNNDEEKRLAHQKKETACIDVFVVILRQRLHEQKDKLEMQKNHCLNHQLTLTNTQN